MAILQHCAPEISVDLVELHRAVLHAATGYFGVPKDEPRIKLFLQDGLVVVIHVCVYVCVCAV